MTNPPKPIITLTIDADTLTTLARLDTEPKRLAVVELLVSDASRRRQRIAPDAVEQMRRLLDQIDEAL